jgi:hypothetical protein
MGVGPTDLHELGVEFRDAMVEALATIPFDDPTLLGAPSRAYVSPGLPVFDCPEMLAVHLTPILELEASPIGLAAAKRVRLAHITYVRVTGTIIRCVPTGMNEKTGNYVVPGTVELETAAKQIHADAWALWNHLWNLIHAGELLPRCSGVIFEGMTQVIPMGGSAGWEIRIRAQLDGYQEMLGS